MPTYRNLDGVHFSVGRSTSISAGGKKLAERRLEQSNCYSRLPIHWVGLRTAVQATMAEAQCHSPGGMSRQLADLVCTLLGTMRMYFSCTKDVDEMALNDPS